MFLYSELANLNASCVLIFMLSVLSTPLLPNSALRSEMVKKVKEDPKAKKTKGNLIKYYCDESRFIFNKGGDI